MGKTVTWPTGEETIRQVARESDGTCLLSFSCGKDSIAAWLALRPHFKRIVPVYMYLVPNLGFVERSLAYYEAFFGQRIIRMPHPSLYRWLGCHVFQAPERVCVVQAARLPRFDYQDVQKAVKEDMGLPLDTLAAVGTRACDSPLRRAAFNRTGPVNRKSLQFFPVWDWNKAQVVKAIRQAGVKLPPEYRVFGRSFDGIDFRFLHGIREHWPEDYQRILDWFPLAELELKRWEFAQQHTQEQGS